jgi:hypothetical protein
MTTETFGSRSSRSSTSALGVGVMLVVITLSFLFGRATVVSPRPQAPEASPPATSQPAEPPPWSEHGFRDDQSAPDGCVTSDCNG